MDEDYPCCDDFISGIQNTLGFAQDEAEYRLGKEKEKYSDN